MAKDPETTPVLTVETSPHVHQPLTTQRVMIDVLIGLLPAVVAAALFFRVNALLLIVACCAAGVVTELLFNLVRRKPSSLGDSSVLVTGVILALSLPPSFPWWAAVIGTVVGVALGKMVYGGLGHNMFNPAMVGRAFVMICFASAMGASAYVVPDSAVTAITQATPMTVLKQTAQAAPLWALLLGNTNGSLGETSAIACLVGGLYLCVRRTASWEIPAGALLAVAVVAGLMNLADRQADWTVLHHLAGGALLFGAFFIATDPASSPLVPKGKFIFGAGFGLLVMVMRVFSGYPEGVMFAVLLMNAVVPLINRWTIPRPVGGPVPGGAKG